jgi:hypothetical protein
MVDYHWGFDRMAQAERFANSLRDFADKPEVVVLRIQSRDDGIAYLVTDATDLPFATGSFDFATAFMSIMDMSNPAPLCARRRESCGRAVSCNSRSCIRVSSRRIAASCGSPTARHGPSSSDRGRAAISMPPTGGSIPFGSRTYRRRNGKRRSRSAFPG